MTRAEAIAELPLAHAVALRLRDAGASVGLIAAALAIDVDAVGSELGLAQAKLEALLRARSR